MLFILIRFEIEKGDPVELLQWRAQFIKTRLAPGYLEGVYFLTGRQATIMGSWQSYESFKAAIKRHPISIVLPAQFSIKNVKREFFNMQLDLRRLHLQPASSNLLLLKVSQAASPQEAIHSARHYLRHRLFVRADSTGLVLAQSNDQPESFLLRTDWNSPVAAGKFFAELAEQGLDSRMAGYGFELISFSEPALHIFDMSESIIKSRETGSDRKASKTKAAGEIKTGRFKQDKEGLAVS